VGNASEVREAIEVLRGEREGRFTDLCVALAGHMAALTGQAQNGEKGSERAREALASGAALERFSSFVEAQGGDPRIVEDPSLLPRAPVCEEVVAEREGWLKAVDTEAVGQAAAAVGAGRQKKEDDIDLAVGIDFLVSIGDEVNAEAVLARVWANEKTEAEAAGREVLEALSWSEEPVAAPRLIHAVLGR
jgi:thymidine phosphorylase